MSGWDSDYVSMWDTLQTLRETVALVKFTNTVTVADECLAETVTMWDTWQTLSETVVLVKLTNTVTVADECLAETVTMCSRLLTNSEWMTAHVYMDPPV